MSLSSPTPGSTARRRIVYIHVPKTAGTAVRNAVARSGPEWSVAPHVTEANYEALLGGGYSYFSGHIGFTTAQAIGGDIVTVLRDPVDRIVSCYYFWRHLHETGREDSVKTALAARYSLDEFLVIKDEVSLIDELFNRMTWQIACSNMLHVRQAARMTYLTEEALLGRAIENLQTMAVVGLQERMDRFVAALKSRFALTVVLPRDNVTIGRISRDDVPVRTVQRIAEWAYLDLELYRATARMLG